MLIESTNPRRHLKIILHTFPLGLTSLSCPECFISSLTSVEKELDGLLLTLWDDDSPHFELYKRGIYAFAEYTWGGNDLSSKDFKSKFRHKFFSPSFNDPKFEFIDDLDKPVRDWANLFIKEKKHRNQITKTSLPLETHIVDLPEINNPGKWNQKFDKKTRTYITKMSCDLTL